jgi:hypothetical protein
MANAAVLPRFGVLLLALLAIDLPAFQQRETVRVGHLQHQARPGE